MHTDCVTQNGLAVLVTGRLFANPSDAMWLRAAAKADVIAAVAQFQGRCQVADSQGHRWDSGEIAAGAQCVGIVSHPDGWQVTWMRAPYGATYGRTVLDLELREIGPRTVTPCEGTSQGFWNVALGAEPIWADSQTFARLPGLTLSHWTTIGPWTIGQDRTSGARVSAWHAGRQKAYEVSRIDTPVPSHLAIEADGTAVVAVGFTEVMVREEQFVPWQPWEEAPVALAPFAPAPIRCIPFDWPDVPNVADVFAWGTFRLGDSTELAKVVTSAKTRGVPSLGVYDGAFDVTQLPALLDVVGIECYPTVGVDVDVLVTRARQAITSCRKAERPCALVVAVYTGSGAWDLRQVRLLLRGLWTLASEYGLDVLPFGNLRPPVHSELIDDLKAMLAAAKGHPAQKPIPAPTPAPTPVPPKKDRPMQKTDSISYRDAHDGLAPRNDGRTYGVGFLDCYRLMALGTPMADVLADREAPTQTPWPNIAYEQVAPMASALQAARSEFNKGIGYNDAVLDCWRIFGPERWPVAYVLADIAGGKLPPQPFKDPF